MIVFELCLCTIAPHLFNALYHLCIMQIYADGMHAIYDTICACDMMILCQVWLPDEREHALCWGGG